MPAIYAQVTWFAFTALKVFWLQAWVGLTLPAYLVLACRRPEYRPPLNLVMLALLLRMASLALSTLVAEDPYKAWWGIPDRMEGLWSLIHFAAWSVMAAGVARTWRTWRRFLHIEIVVGLLAGCVVILQLPFPKILGQATDARVSGLFGNPFFSAAYHSLIVFLVAFLWTQEKQAQDQRAVSRGASAVYLATIGVSIAAIVLAGSRGALLGFASGVAASLLAWGFLAQRRKLVLFAVLGAAAVAALYLGFALGVAPRPGLEAFWRRHENLRHLFLIADDADRLSFWKLALSGIREHPLLGWGHGNFENMFDRHFVPLQGCGTAGADDAHNVVLQTLVTTGVLGLAAYLLLWAAVVRSVLRAHTRGSLGKLPAAILLGAPVVHVVQILFNPESPGPLFLCYVVFALAAWLTRLTPAATAQARRKPGAFAFALAETAAVVLVVVGTLLPACASEYALLAITEYKHRRPQEFWPWARRAAALPTPYLEDQLLVDLQLLLSLAESRTLDRLPAWRELLAVNRALAERYLAHHEELIIRSTYARMLYAVGAATEDASLKNEGERRLRETLRDNPQRQSVMYALASMLAGSGRPDEAEGLLRKALAEEPRIGESHFRLGRFLWGVRHREAEGAALIAAGARASYCPYWGASLEELSVTAAAFDRVGDKQGLTVLASTAHDLPPSPAAAPYLALALHLERAGLLAERDGVLRFGMRHAPEVARHAAPVLQRKVTTLAEAERQGAASAQAQPGR